MFLLRSAFWMFVVASFLPSDLAPPAQAQSTSAIDRKPVVDAAAMLDAFCERDPEICAAGDEASILAQIAAVTLAEKTLRSFEERGPVTATRGE